MCCVLFARCLWLFVVCYLLCVRAPSCRLLLFVLVRCMLCVAYCLLCCGCLLLVVSLLRLVVYWLLMRFVSCALFVVCVCGVWWCVLFVCICCGSLLLLVVGGVAFAVWCFFLVLVFVVCCLLFIAV